MTPYTSQPSASSKRPRAATSTRPYVFSPYTLHQQLLFDATIRWSIVTAIIAYLVFSPVIDANAPGWSTFLGFALVGAWLAMSFAASRVTHQIPHMTALIDTDPAAAERLLAANLRRIPLSRSIRLILYHRLAVLRHSQHRFPETAAICHAVLTHYPPALTQRDPLSVPTFGSGPALNAPGLGSHVRSHLLIMLVDAHLRGSDLLGAYLGLTELHRLPLNLVDLIQRVVLQTRYELAAGHDHAVLRDVKQKVNLAEIMPPAQCGAMHAMLALAAKRTDHTTLAHWLQQRAQLLCSPQQLQAIGIPATSF